ncbi:hypothetical protein M9Y10_027385 [Tritrichomonas musculus]|uniref:Leucine-rich repeat domain-containing protein n=1 Tax=Tritrichomonas musculus TaxID=1915356 RepID=A0ABR2H4S5_9EUKA
MQYHKEFTFIVQAKTYKILASFPYLQDVDEKIYKQLISTNQYEVKSRVSEEVFQSFINHWTKNELPNLQIDNLNEFEQLSKEFDRMQNLIQIFKKTAYKCDIPSLKKENQDLIEQFQASDKKVEWIIIDTATHHKIIDILFNSYLASSAHNFLIFQTDQIWEACLNGDIDNLDFITRKKTLINGIEYAINEEDKTASLFRNISAEGDIEIPSSFNYESNEYKITSLSNFSFQYSINIGTLTFSEDCEIPFICKDAFSYCEIQNLIIPFPVTICNEAFYRSQIERIELKNIKLIEKSAFATSIINSIAFPSNFNGFQKGWCKGLRVEKFIITKTDEDLISFYNDQFLIGKSDRKSDIFDVILCANRYIEKLNIPPFITKIAPFAFNCCYDLEQVVIPSQVVEIGKAAFGSCESIETIEISNDSNLKSIRNKAFKSTNLKSIFIPSSLIELEDGWCYKTQNLMKVLISPKNDHFLCLNQQFILGKSSVVSDCYDVLLFAYRNIKKAVIPFFVRSIAPFAFDHCFNLTEIEFTSNSNLTSIGKFAFANSSIRSISIPSSVKYIGKRAFYFSQLERIEFQNDSKLHSLKDEVYHSTNIKSFIIPRSVKIIDYNSLSFHQFCLIEIEDITQFNFLNISGFVFESNSIMLPHQ